MPTTKPGNTLPEDRSPHRVIGVYTRRFGMMLAQSSYTEAAWNNLLAEADDRAELPSWAEHQQMVAETDLPALVLDVDDVTDMFTWVYHNGHRFNADGRAAYIFTRLQALAAAPAGSA